MLSRPFIILYASVFVATMGISMVSPVLPVYAEELGATGIWIGATFSVFAVTQTIFGPPIGRLSDKYGRKWFIVAGLLIYFVAAMGYLTAGTFIQVFIFRAISGLGTACIFAVARAYVGDMVPPGREGRWFGMFATADIVGFGVGPLVAGVIREFFGFEAVFVSMAFIMISTGGFVTFLLPPQSRARAGWEGRAADISFVLAMKNRLVIALTLVMGLISVTFGATFSFLAVLLEERLLIGPALIGIAFSMASLSAGLAQPFFGRMADRFNRRLLVSLGLAASAVALLGIGTVPPYWVMLGLLLLMGIGEAVSMVSASAMQVVAGRFVGMGTVIGLGAAGQGIGIVFGGVAAGSLVDGFGLEAAFVFSGLSMLLGIIPFVVLTAGQPTRDEEVLLRPDGGLEASPHPRPLGATGDGEAE
jgi:MFS transporter, DHA1 family, multidrug resistance protein